MKKFLFSAMALSALVLASCSIDDLSAPAGDGPVTFSVSLPGDFTRTISDGTKAVKLSYAVYLKGQSDVLFTSQTATDPQADNFVDLKTTLSLDLAKGKTYDIIFWADVPGNSYYTFTPATKSVTMDYSAPVGNDEDRDAFFQHVELEVKGASTQTVELRRPFAQLNFATSDFAAAKKAGLNYGGSKVVVKNVYNTLNLLDGKASGAAEVTFNYAGLVENEATTHPGTTDASKKYNWLSMNYLLTGAVVPDATNVQKADKEVVDVAFQVYAPGATEGVAGDLINTVNVANVPVQRNYRTNIYGALLTSTVNFNIIIDPIYYEDDYDVEYTVVNSNEDLTNAIAAGESNIRLDEGDYTLNYPSTASADLKIVGAGKDKTTLSINKSFYTNGKNISFAGLTYEVPTGLTYDEFYFGFIQRAGDVSFSNCKIVGGLRLNLSAGEVATIDNCEFEVNTQSGFDGYPLFYYAATGSKVVVSNSTFKSKGKGIIMYCESAQKYDLTVNNCTFEASETTDKCAIQMHTEWGISGTLNINNCTATGFQDKNNGLWYEVNNSTHNQTMNFNIFVNGEQVQTAE